MTVLRTLVGTTLRVLSGAARTTVPPGYVTFTVGADISQNAVLNWSAPRFYGGSAVTGYQVTVNGGSPVSLGSTTFTYTATLSGAGTYTFQVSAVSAVGTGPSHTISGTFGSSSVNTVVAPSSLGDGTNRSVDFQAWLDSVPDGSVADLTGRSIRCDQTIQLDTRSTLKILNGTLYTDDPTGYGPYTVFAPSTSYVTTDNVTYQGNTYNPVVNFTSGTSFVATDWKRIGGANGNDPRTRSHWNISNCTDVTFTSHTVRGANTTGLYNSALEAQTAFNLHGCTNVVIDSTCSSTQVFGDHVCIAPLLDAGTILALPDQITVDGLYGRLNGRQGVSITGGTNILIENCDLDQLSRAAFDLEPTNVGWTIDTVTIQNNAIGSHKLNFVSSLGASAPVNNITITGNTCTGDTVGGSIGRTGYRRSNWTFTNNTSDTPSGSGAGGALIAQNIDGLTVTGNVQPIQSTHVTYMLKATTCTGIVCSGNTGANLAGQYIET